MMFFCSASLLASLASLLAHVSVGCHTFFVPQEPTEAAMPASAQSRLVERLAQKNKELVDKVQQLENQRDGLAISMALQKHLPAMLPAMPMAAAPMAGPAPMMAMAMPAAAVPPMASPMAVPKAAAAPAAVPSESSGSAKSYGATPKTKAALRGPYPSVNSNVLPWKRQDVTPEERQRRDKKNAKEKRRKDKQH